MKIRLRRKKRTETTILTREVWPVSRPGGPDLAWCPQCGQAVRLLTPEEAAAVRGVSTRAVYRWVEAGRLHFTETEAGRLLICLSSLLELI